MFIKRSPLGEGNLSFRRRRRFPVFFILLYLTVLIVALFVWWQADRFRPMVMSAIGPTPEPTMAAPELTTMGYEAYLDGDVAEAVTYYQQALELQPDNLDIMDTLAFSLAIDFWIDSAKTQSVVESLAIAEQMVALAPEDPRGYAAKARALNFQGFYPEANLEALRAIERDPDYVYGHIYLAESYTYLGRLRQALEQANVAVEMAPYNVEARRSYATILEYYGDYDGAIAQYEQSLRIEPNRLDLLYGRARNLRAAGRTDEAVAMFGAIISLDPEDPLPYVELGKTYFEIRDDDAAQNYLQSAVEKYCADCPLNREVWNLDNPEYWPTSNEPRPQLSELPEEVFMPAWQRLGMVYLTRRNYEDAIDILEEAIVWGETSAVDVPMEMHYVVASAYYYRASCEQSVAHAVTALNLYEERELNDSNALVNTLRIFVLCRDYNFEGNPVRHQGPGFVNGFPEGYTEPNVVVEAPDGSDANTEAEDESDEMTEDSIENTVE